MLSDLMARQAKATGKPYSLADFDGLYLYVSAIGSKVWHFRYSWLGKRERITFGCYPALSLKQARDLREEARALLAKDILKDMPTTPENIANQVQIDVSFWADNGEQLEQRFNSWAAK